MKRIKLHRGYVISAGKGLKENINDEFLREIMRPVEENKLIILNAVFDIERVLDRVITYYFFRDQPEALERATAFENLLLKSDWFNFSPKRKVVIHIVQDESLLESGEKNTFEQLLRKAMSYRNAFAHGEFSTDGREVRLNYFEGRPQSKVLTDVYLAGIENNLRKCWDLTLKVARKIGAY